MGHGEKEETDYGVHVQLHRFYLNHMSSPKTYYVIEECGNQIMDGLVWIKSRLGLNSLIKVECIHVFSWPPQYKYNQKPPCNSKYH